MMNFRNELKECSMDALITSYHLAKDYRMTCFERMIKLRERIAKLEYEFNDCNNNMREIHERITKYENQHTRLAKEVSELTEMILDLKHEILTR